MSLRLRLNPRFLGTTQDRYNLYQAGFLGTPNPTIPYLKLDAPGALYVPPTYDTVTLDVAGADVNNVGSPDETRTVSITVGNNPNRLLIVWVGMNNSAGIAVSTLTFNSVGLTKIGELDQVGDQQFEIWQMVAPPVGTFNLVATPNQIDGATAMAWAVLYNVDQTTPLSAVSSAGRQTDGLITVTPTGMAQGYPIAAAWSWTTGSAATITSSGGQTRIATNLTGESGFFGFWGIAVDTEAVIVGAQSLGFTVGGGQYAAEALGVVARPAIATATAKAFPPIDYTRLAFAHMLRR